MITDLDLTRKSISPFDSRIAFEIIGINSNDANSLYLLDPEESIIASATSPKRQLEFRLGRIAARRALESLGLGNNMSVLRGDAGEPLWPDGIKGSIAHSSGTAIAAVTKDKTIAGIGIDIENLSRTRELKVFDRILTAGERQYVHDMSDDEGEKFLRAIKIFSAKEACFKAFYEAACVKLTFKDASFSSSESEEALIGIILADTMSQNFKKGFTFSCNFRIVANHLISGVILNYPCA